MLPSQYGYVIGIIYGLYFKRSIALFYIPIFCIIAIAKYIVKVYKRANKIKIFRYIKVLLKKQAILIMAFAAIVSNTYLMHLNGRYNKFYDSMNDKINIIGIIESEPIESKYNYKYIIKSIDREYNNKKFLLYVKKDKKNLLEYGDLIKVSGDFSIPDTKRNYKGFDYREYLKAKKIFGIILTNNRNIEVIEKKQSNIIYTVSNNIRKTIIEKVKRILPEETSSLLIGILLGETSYISEEVVENFKTSSLSHVLAVSGAHTSYIVLCITYLLNKGRVSKREINIIIIFVLLLFMFITGLTPSVIRACIMGIILVRLKNIL